MTSNGARTWLPVHNGYEHSKSEVSAGATNNGSFPGDRFSREACDFARFFFPGTTLCLVLMFKSVFYHRRN